MAKVGTLEVEPVAPPTVSITSKPTTGNEGDTLTYKVSVTSNAAVDAGYALGVIISSGSSYFKFTGDYVTISAGSTGTLVCSADLNSDDNGNATCAGTYNLSGMSVDAKYGGTTYFVWIGSTFTVTISVAYIGKLTSGHTLPSTVYLGKSASFTIKGKNTNKCRKESMYVKVKCVLQTDSTKYFEFTGTSKDVSADTETSFTVSGTVPKTTPVGTYDVYAELYAGAATT